MALNATASRIVAMGERKIYGKNSLHLGELVALIIAVLMFLKPSLFKLGTGRKAWIVPLIIIAIAMIIW